MDSKKMLTLVALGLTSQFVQAEEATVPDWHLQADRLIAAVDGIQATFLRDKNEYTSWKDQANSLRPLFDTRDSERRQLANCLRSSYQARVKQLEDCQALLAQKDTNISELNNHIASLELTIASLNSTLAQLRLDLADAQAKYNELVATDADKAAELIGELQALQTEYNNMLAERNNFRSALQALYNRAHQYNGDASSEYLALAHDICGENFAFENN